MKTAFITGINGFTGRHLAKFLGQQNVRVTGADLNKNDYYHVDLTNKQAVAEILQQEQPDYIFHLASPVIRSDQLIDEALEKNLQVDLFGSVNLIEAAAKLKTKPRMLITGTAAEYDTEIKRARWETDSLRPNTSYGLSKMTQELISRQLCHSYEIPLVYTRSFLLIGPGQSPGFVITDWCRHVAAKDAGLKTGNLAIERDFTDVSDAVRAYWLLINKGKAGEVYNVCSGEKIQLRKIMEILKKLAEYKFEIIEDKSKFRNNDPQALWGDNRKIKALGWQPEVSLEESLKKIVNQKIH